MTPNKEKPDILSSGLTIIAKGVNIPDNTVVGRNCRIFSYVNKEDLNGEVIPSGSTITHEK